MADRVYFSFPARFRQWLCLSVFSVSLVAVFAAPVWAAPKAPDIASPKTTELGKPHLGIAAQVGDEAISSLDVDNRIKFIIATAHLSDTPDVIDHIRPQIVRSLVDEKLQLQEATKNDITVTEQDINEAIEAIEQQRSMPAGAIFEMLETNHVPKETFLHQLRAQISWNRVLTKKIRPLVRVSDNEIAMAGTKYVAETQKKSSVAQEYRIGAIALPVDKPAREKEMGRLGEKLVKELHSGASFEEVARQFSSGAANAGGKVETFWVRLEQLDPNIARALETAATGAVVGPIRTSEGYTIIRVYEMHDVGGKSGKEAKEPKEEAAKPADHDQVYAMLLQQKMELEAQKYMRNLRRETFIDIR